MEKYYTLNEVAMMTGLTTRTLRNYLKMNVVNWKIKFQSIHPKTGT